MTWYYSADGESIDIYDHKGNQIVGDMPFSATWSETPDVVYQIMAEEIEAAVSNGDIEYAVAALAQALAEDIERGVP